MYYSNRKLLGFSVVFAIGLGGLIWSYTGSQGVHIRSWKAESRGAGKVANTAGTPAGGLLTSDADTRAIAARDARKVRSPAFVPGSKRETELKASLSHWLAEPKIAEAHARLRDYFPESVPMNFWIRAAMALGTHAPEGETSPARFEAAGKVYSALLEGDESTVTSLQSGLQSLPFTETAFRGQAFRMLSDLALRNPELRGSVKDVLLNEAARAGNRPDAAVAFQSLLRVNPTKAWYQEVARAYEKQHPGSELSDFVALNVANL
ncbi:MAG: hypothetical protein JST04_11420 [Bdellovibrionales bacterium]|nr:hypothetical protein [Bdellovibrionales bacterium]